MARGPWQGSRDWAAAGSSRKLPRASIYQIPATHRVERNPSFKHLSGISEDNWATLETRPLGLCSSSSPNPGPCYPRQPGSCVGT